jgi:hypothetical protein
MFHDAQGRWGFSSLVLIALMVPVVLSLDYLQQWHTSWYVLVGMSCAAITCLARAYWLLWKERRQAKPEEDRLEVALRNLQTRTKPVH